MGYVVRDASERAISRPTQDSQSTSAELSQGAINLSRFLQIMHKPVRIINLQDSQRASSAESGPHLVRWFERIVGAAHP